MTLYLKYDKSDNKYTTTNQINENYSLSTFRFVSGGERFSGIYWIEHKKDGHIYIGESSDVSKRHLTHSGRTYFSAVRRNLGETILGFNLQTIKGKKRYFSEKEEEGLNKYLNDCTIKTMPISFGRFELEEYLIKKHKPVLNRKENK